MSWLRRTAAAGTAAAALTGALVLSAPTAQAATATHCTTSSTTSLLVPTYYPNLPSFFISPLSACGGTFTDTGAPYTFTIDTFNSSYVPIFGPPIVGQTFANIHATCTAVTVDYVSNPQLIRASGCTYS